MSSETVRFGLLCSMFEAMGRDRSSAKKRSRFRTFLDRVYTAKDDYFAAVRLILPSLDRERGTYGLKEAALAAVLVEALGIAKDSQDALRLVNWRKGGVRAGANAGNFALVAAEVLERRQGRSSGGLTIREINNALDELAVRKNQGEKASVLSGLIMKTNAVEMKWILMIILKDLKLGISERSIFNEFHPDAEDLFNVTCDLKLICEKLNDRSQRHKRQDIEVGKAVRPQLALRVSDAATAWKKLHGKEIVAECKFDGDRIQIHKNGNEINYFSRNFLDHSEYAHGMSGVILQNVLADRCILDGEMLVWDSSTQRFAEFGANQGIAKAAREGLESDRQLCFVVFDVLYVGDTSIIHQSLAERHEYLRKVVLPLKGRLEILVPEGGLNDHRAPGEPCWSIKVHNLDDIERFFKQTIENRDEGIVVKDLGSKWEPSDRSGKWLKLKPDYVHPGSDLDVLILGGYFGSGRRGGEVAQFLLGLAEPSPPGTHPRRFLSFCRVGTGLSDDELNSLVEKLKPYFRKNDNPKKPPRFYEVTNNSKERPDVWIESPDKSVILSITSDIRTIKSEVFAAPYSLRFPRILRIRYDKLWHECLDVQTFVDLVHSSNGSVQRGTDGILPHDYGTAKVRVPRKAKQNLSQVPAHFVKTDISDVKKETYIFMNMMFYFANTPASYSVDFFHKLVVENGGNFSMNLNDSVTHCIAAEKKGIRYQAATRHGDIIHYSWVLDCCAQKCLIHLQPKYYLFITESSKRKFQEEMDDFADYYFWDVDYIDLKQIFSNMKGSDDLRKINYYRRKYCPSLSWCIFEDCNIYFLQPFDSIGADFKTLSELTSRRLKLEVTLHGGEVVKNIDFATHLIAYLSRDWIKDFEELYKSFTTSGKYAVHRKKLPILRHEWIEDCISEGRKLAEDEYNLKPRTFESFEMEERREDTEATASSHAFHETEKPTNVAHDGRGEKRRRGRPPTSGVRKHQVKKSARPRARIGSRFGKTDQEESDGSDPSENKLHLNDSDNKEYVQKITLREEVDPVNSEGVKKAPTNPPTSTRKGKHAIGPPKQIRPRPIARHAKIKEDESETENRFDSKHRSHRYKSEEAENATQVEEVNDSYHLHGNPSPEQWAVPEPVHRKGAEDSEGTSSNMNSSNLLKIEGSAIDPVQAMLFDMIPSLSQRERACQQPLVEDREPQKDHIPEVTEPTDAKKKKVSYKDVADKLLKDWL